MLELAEPGWFKRLEVGVSKIVPWLRRIFGEEICMAAIAQQSRMEMSYIGQGTQQDHRIVYFGRDLLISPILLIKHAFK